MSKAKYTPGKWRVDVRNNGRIMGAIALNSPTVCTMEIPTIGTGTNETHLTPDATLIAAAPELFELGREAVDLICDGNRCSGCMDEGTCKSQLFKQLIERLESEVTK